jgi:hypothetical protein
VIADAVRHGPRNPGVLVLVVALLFGVLGMHGLASPASGHGSRPEVTAGHSDCDRAAHSGETPCPEDDTGHPGPICQAGAVMFALAMPVPPGTVTSVPAPVAPSRLTATAAEEAAHGTGCGPPLLSELSISRT